MSLIYHITRREQWHSAAESYRGDTLATQGFIHCSTAAQVPRAGVEEARSNVANALLELERFERLHGEGAVSRQVLDTAKNLLIKELAIVRDVKESDIVKEIEPSSAEDSRIK